MPSVHEIHSERFQRWELRGRGWQVFENPVYPEPPFVPFGVDQTSVVPRIDDGHHPTFLSSLVQRISRKLSTEIPPRVSEVEPEPEPQQFVRGPLVELQISLPSDSDHSKELFEQFLYNLSLCDEPLSFEIMGIPRRVTVQCAAKPKDASKIRQQVQAHFSDVVLHPREAVLQNAWESCSGNDALILEFGLANPFMLPLTSGKLDPYIGVIGALSELREGDFGLFQVLFQPVSAPWSESIERSVTHSDGKPFFVNAPELARAAESKISKRLYAVVVRVAAKAAEDNRAFEIARDVACALTVFNNPNGNELIPLSNTDYDFGDHVEDTLARQTRRSGMILNTDELIGLVHLPSKAVQSSAFVRQSEKSKAAPQIARHKDGVFIGNNVHLEESNPIWISAEQRIRHTHIIGVSGTGKSSLLFNLIRQDIENGDGLAVFDPHGDLVDKILGIVPAQRIHDVVLVDPSDEQYAVGFNILQAHSELEKTLLASDLVSAFQRLSSSWGDQLQSVMQNAILAFLESSRPGTLYDLRRFLIEPAFRAEFLKSVTKPNVLYYWQKAFTHLSGSKSIGPVVTRLDTFFAKEPILHMVAQQKNRLDFAHIMDSGKIFLAKLPEGLLGKDNSHLLGSFLISKFQQMAMSRQAVQAEARRNFWIYADEFHNFITPSMAEILSGARKYHIGLTLAHHELRQLQKDSEVASAVLSHPCTRICFRLGDEDARKMAEGFSFFEARDLQNLGVGEAIARIERSDFDFNLTVPPPEPVDSREAAQRQTEIIAASRAKYGTLRSTVEAALLASITSEPPPKASKPEPVTPKPVTPAPPPAPPKSETIEAQNVTVSEKKIPEPTPEKPIAAEVPKQSDLPSIKPPAEAKESKEEGRGGDLHVTLQDKFQKAAWRLGLKAYKEKPVKKGSQQAADLVIEADGFRMAVEFPVEGSLTYEFKNIRKCLKAGFTRVAVVSLRQSMRKNLSEAVAAALEKQDVSKVSFYSPEQFEAELENIAREIAAQPKSLLKNSSEKIGNYEVESEYPEITPSENKQIEEARIRMIAATMRKKGGKE